MGFRSAEESTTLMLKSGWKLVLAKSELALRASIANTYKWSGYSDFAPISWRHILARSITNYLGGDRTRETCSWCQVWLLLRAQLNWLSIWSSSAVGVAVINGWSPWTSGRILQIWRSAKVGFKTLSIFEYEWIPVSCFAWADTLDLLSEYCRSVCWYVILVYFWHPAANF